MTEIMRRDLVELGCPEDRVRVHYHGIDTRRFRSPAREYDNAEPITILCSGRLAREKGQHRLVEAFARHRRRHGAPRSRLVLVGEGPLRPALETSIDRLGLRDCVQLTGHVSHGSAELARLYGDADIFCLASEAAGGSKEGIPGTLVEAMASGLPVVSTRHGGIPSVVSEREGILVDEGDVGGLEVALSCLAGDSELRRRLGASGAQRAAAEFDIVPATAALERIYDDVIAR
jgi:glycosyltransferase involved in cell wall biosynthesis